MTAPDRQPVLGLPGYVTAGTYREALRELARVRAELATANEALTEARKTVSAYYDDHVIDGDPPCPCESCDKARKVFRRQLAAVSSGEPANEETNE